MDIVSLWKKTLQLIKGEVASASFETFFKNTVPIETDSNELTLLAPNEFAEDILRTRYLNLIESCLSQLTSNKFEIKIISASLLYSLIDELLLSKSSLIGDIVISSISFIDF